MFLFLYVLFISFILSISDFYAFWFFMEVGTLLFMGIGLCVLGGGLSQFMVFLIIQTLAAFCLLVGFSVGLGYVLSLAFIVKLGMFPFYFWFVNVGYVFPSLYLFLSMTLFKVPSMMLFGVFGLYFLMSVIFISLIFTLLVGGGLMVGSNSVRMLLVGSSVGNNSWFILSQMVDFFLFLVFMGVYSLVLFLIFSLLGGSLGVGACSFLFGFSVLSISGLPPFPVFFLKMAVVLGVFLSFGGLYFVMLMLLINVTLVLGYLKFLFNVSLSSGGGSVGLIIF